MKTAKTQFLLKSKTLMNSKILKLTRNTQTDNLSFVTFFLQWKFCSKSEYFELHSIQMILNFLYDEFCTAFLQRHYLI